MSKIIKASCALGVVKYGDFPIAGAEILSEGQGASSGVAAMVEEDVYYITSNASDIKEALLKIVSALDTIATTFTSIGASMTGPTTAPPPTLATNVATIQAAKTALDTLRTVLK